MAVRVHGGNVARQADKGSLPAGLVLQRGHAYIPENRPIELDYIYSASADFVRRDDGDIGNDTTIINLTEDLK